MSGMWGANFGSGLWDSWNKQVLDYQARRNKQKEEERQKQQKKQEEAEKLAEAARIEALKDVNLPALGSDILGAAAGIPIGGILGAAAPYMQQAGMEQNRKGLYDIADAQGNVIGNVANINGMLNEIKRPDTEYEAKKRQLDLDNIQTGIDKDRKLMSNSDIQLEISKRQADNADRKAQLEMQKMQKDIDNYDAMRAEDSRLSKARLQAEIALANQRNQSAARELALRKSIQDGSYFGSRNQVKNPIEKGLTKLQQIRLANDALKRYREELKALEESKTDELGGRVGRIDMVKQQIKDLETLIPMLEKENIFNEAAQPVAAKTQQEEAAAISAAQPVVAGTAQLPLSASMPVATGTMPVAAKMQQQAVINKSPSEKRVSQVLLEEAQKDSIRPMISSLLQGSIEQYGRDPETRKSVDNAVENWGRLSEQDKLWWFRFYPATISVLRQKGKLTAQDKQLYQYFVAQKLEEAAKS